MPTETPPTISPEERRANTMRNVLANLELSRTSFKAGFEAGTKKAMPLYFWAGVKVGGLCCGLLGLGLGVAGGMFWTALGVAAR